jgi:protein involved in polysaccharide export with SLBB domain
MPLHSHFRIRQLTQAVSFRWVPALVMAAALTVAGVARAQSSGGSDIVPARGLTRAQLTEEADSLRVLAQNAKLSPEQRQHLGASEHAIRERLADGDFLVGDRIVVTVLGQRELTDTFTVRQHREVLFPNLSPLSLQGVLRGEVEQHVAEFVAKYVKNPSVKVVPLLRLSVEGSVTRPGFYSVPSDALLSDVIMRAGGPAADGDVSHTVVRREGNLFWGDTFLPEKLYGGATVDALGLRSGDQVVVAEVHKTNNPMMFQLALSALGAVTMLYALYRR